MMSSITTQQDAALGKTAKTLEMQVSFGQGLTLAEIEKAVILETLKRQSFNRTRAARVLGIGIRTLQRKLKQYRSDLGIPMLADA
jgi:DNA-binding NtrC family response regulator